MFKKSKKLAYQVHVEACLVDIVGLGAQNWDPSPGVGVEEGVHEILETYPLDGHSQVEAAGLVDMHPEMEKSTDSNLKIFLSGKVLPFKCAHLDFLWPS